MIRIVGWSDNRAVQLASNLTCIEPLHKCKRYSKKERKDLEILQPNIVKFYNSSICGVDLSDMLQNLYCLHHKSKNWQIRIYFWILNTSVINAWSLYQKTFSFFQVPGKHQFDLLNFTSEVSFSIVHNNIAILPSEEGDDHA